MSGSPKAYLVAEVAIQDADGFEEYRSAVAPMIAAFGGRYLVRGGTVTSLEGEAQTARVVVIEFPDLASARHFWSSDEYAPVAAIRHRTARSRIFMAEGVPVQ